MDIDPAAARTQIDRIIAELKRLGWWREAPPSGEAFANMGAFGMGTMAFSEWLQFVLVRRVEEILAHGGGWPPASHVGAHAIREYDGLDEAGNLVTLLCEWDALFNQA